MAANRGGETRSNDFTKCLSRREPSTLPPCSPAPSFAFSSPHARLCRRIIRVRASRVRVASPRCPRECKYFFFFFFFLFFFFSRSECALSALSHSRDSLFPAFSHERNARRPVGPRTDGQGREGERDDRSTYALFEPLFRVTYSAS